jgi:hypothetical protein
MGIYKVEIVHATAAQAGVGEWRNVYHLNAASIGDANLIADTIINAEEAMHSDQVDFLSKRISDTAHLEPTITTFLTAQNGDQSWGVDQLPFWNVCRVDFRDASGGRMERKYYRLGLTLSEVDGTKISVGIVTTLQAVIDTLVSDVIALCSPTGDTVVEGVVDVRVGMRQLHWHRRKRPGFHRGYVPD